jgi:hypothetical protein
MVSQVQFLFRKEHQTQNETFRSGEVFVDNNRLCYFAERTVADGIAPSSLQLDGEFGLVVVFEEEAWRISLRNPSDSTELSFDTVATGNGIWFTDHASGADATNGNQLLDEIADTLNASKSQPNEFEARVLSWIQGAVYSIDAQAGTSPTSAGEDRISPDLKLSSQWDFDGLKFGDSGTMEFSVQGGLNTAIRIEYTLKSDLNEQTNLNLKLNDLDTVVGLGDPNTGGVEETICVLLSRFELFSFLLKSSDNAIKHTVATNGATVTISKIRIQ